LLNVASQEYAKVADLAQLRTAVRVIDISFLDDGRVLSVFAKRARGLFVRFIGMTQAQTIVDATKFDLEGYQYDQSLSSDDRLVFTRSKAARLAAVKKPGIPKATATDPATKEVQGKSKGKTHRKAAVDDGAPPAKVKPTVRDLAARRVTRSSVK
jgi:hypothetical protein